MLDLPHDALLLTFDDGRTDTVLNAAPILKRVGMRATVFAIGDAWKRSPLYEASPGGLRSLQRQGWSIEAHASAPLASVDAGGGRSLPYLSARRSLGGHLETLAQFRTRAATEYRSARLAAEKLANRPVVAFAWPFGAYGADTRTNDRASPAINLSEARRVYSLGFNEDGQTTFGLLTKATDPMRIARFELVPTLSPRALFERLELAIAATAPEVSVPGRARVAAKWHSRRVHLAPRRSRGALRATAGDAPVGIAPAARPAGQPIVLALTATHPTRRRSGRSRRISRRSACSRPAWLALQPGGRFDYNAADPFTAGLTARGARLVPVLADPDHLAGALLADGPTRRRLTVRLGVALRALGARGVVLDWRDLPPAARGTYRRVRARAARRAGPRAQIIVTVPPVRTMRVLRTGAYDLRALARPARLLVLAWNQHGPRSEPGPVASLAFWKQTLRTVLRAAPRSRVSSWACRPGAGSGARAPGAEQATQAQLFPQATREGDAAPLRRARGRHAWVESDRSVQLKLLTARQARIAGVALWVRGGESSKTWTQPWLAAGLQLTADRRPALGSWRSALRGSRAHP